MRRFHCTADWPIKLIALFWIRERSWGYVPSDVWDTALTCWGLLCWRRITSAFCLTRKLMKRLALIDHYLWLELTSAKPRVSFHLPSCLNVFMRVVFRVSIFQFSNFHSLQYRACLNGSLFFLLTFVRSIRDFNCNFSFFLLIALTFRNFSPGRLHYYNLNNWLM